ncbi:MAG: LamG-like jellyroll fold domain-containing protein [Candidatus Woesearchaeota archaeon]
MQQPDNFDTNTLNTSWTEEAAISPLQTCYININETIPGMAFIGITGNPYPYTTGTCSIISKSIIYGDFDTNITFILKTQIENDTVLAFGISETPTSANASRNAFIALVKQTGLDPAYMTYANDGNITGFISSRNTNDTTGRFRIQRTNNTFTFYSWNNTGNTWITETTQNLNLSNTIYIGLVANNYLPSFGTINASWDNFSLNTINYSVALFNQTNNTGLYNVTVIAINNINGINATQKTNFTIAEINNPPSIPYILSPAPGETIGGIYTITWMQVTDPDNDNLQFNITLLNPDNTFNATIVTNYGNPATTTYPWDTTNYPPGSYKLKITVFENETIEKYATSSTMYGTFTIASKPYVQIIYPFNDVFDTNTIVPIIANITDPLGIKTAYANITLPNGSTQNVTFGRVQQPDNFDADTLNTSWWAEKTIGPSQTCTIDINTTIPGKVFTGIEGNGLPLTDALCSVISRTVVYGDFDINISFERLTSIANDTAITLQVLETPSSANASRLAFMSLSLWTGEEQVYEVYANDENISTYLSRRNTFDNSGKFRIMRQNMTFEFYTWNNTANNWVLEAKSYLNLSKALYVSFEAESTYPEFGTINASWDNFSINTFNYSVALFKQTNNTGVYNVTAIAINNVNCMNNTEKTNFTIAEINNPPSVPYIIKPTVGETISGLYNITWSNVYDDESNNVWFNITLLNSDGTHNSTIITNYGNLSTTKYEWDTSAYENGNYLLEIVVFENETVERHATKYTMPDTFTINDLPRITVIAPINKSFPDRRRVSLVINATDSDGIDTAIASVTLPDLSIENVTMGYRAVSDDFSTDTMGTYWDQYSLTGPSQNCVTDIDTTMPGKAFISLSGDGTPETDTYCMIASTRAIDGDFDINITFDILSRIGQDGIVYLGLTEVPDPTTTSKTILYGISNWSGYEAGYEVYANDENYTGYPLYLRPSNDTSGKLRIKREGNNFSFYYWNNGWIEENLTQNTFDFARGLYVSFQIESAYPGWGSVNLTLDDFEVNSLNYTFAIFNNTWQTGNYNVTFTVNDTSGIINTAFTNFSVYLYNNKPSKPWILAPYIGQLISGLFNITWSPVIDEEEDSLQFNITLLNADFTENQTIISDYGDSSTKNYEWNTSQYPDGIYSLNVTVFENETAEHLSNSDVLAGNFTIDNTPPAVIDLEPPPGTNYSQYIGVNISANVTDKYAGVSVVIAEVTTPTGTCTNYTLSNVLQDKYGFEFNNTATIGQYNVTFIANDTLNNINRTETTFFITYDITPPAVFDPRPIEGYGTYLNGNVSISVIASDETSISTIYANITLPNGTTITTTPVNDAYDSDNSTILLLHLDEESGNLIDSSGNNLTVNIIGTGYEQNITGKFRKGFRFYATDEYISAPDTGNVFDFSATTSFTVEIWANATNISAEQPLIARMDPSDENTPAFMLSITPEGIPYFTIRDATNTNFTATATTNVLEEWHHVAGVRNAQTNECLIYVDGNLEGNTTCPPTGIVLANDLLIGVSGDLVNLMEGMIDEVRISNTTRTGFSPDYYLTHYANLTQRGRYNITFFANDTRNNINATTTTYFIRKPKNIIDLLDYKNKFIDFTINYTNTSGVLHLNITTPHSTIKLIQATEHYESSPYSILRIGAAINESIFPLDTNYTIDASGLNFTTLNITRTATSGTIAYKCAHFNTTTEQCIDLCADGNEYNCPEQPEGLWVPIKNITPGTDYTITLWNTTDPGFAEWNASQREDETNTTLTTPVIAIQSNITPSQWQYLLLGYAELQGGSNLRDVNAFFTLNDTTTIGNASWQPDTSRTSNPPGDYTPFFTHAIKNLNTGAQNLSVKFFSESGQNTYIRRSRAIILKVNNSDALTNESGSTFQTLSPAGIYHSIINLSFTPTTTQPYLVISTAEVAPNSGTQSVLARLLHNGTEKAYLSYEGKASTDIAVFATHLVVNATAGISQNFTLQAQSENAANKQIRNARITAVPLSTVFFNESEPTSTTTTSTWQNKTKLTFTMTSAQEALIIGSADINISSCTNGNFIGTFLALDGQTIGNLTQGCQDYTDAYPFITAQLINLSAGSHTATISYNRIAGSAGIVSIRRARITIIPIAPNQPPSITQVILNTTNPLTNDTDQNLTAYFINVTDPDNDPVKNITDWRVNNNSIAILNMPFEGGSNATFTKDYSTYGNNGTVINATWLQSGGFDGWGAYDFNGIDSRIRIPNDSQNISRYGTWSFWIKINNNNTCQAFLSKRDTFYSNNAWGMGFQFAGPPNIRFEYSPTGGLHNFTIFSGSLLPINKWTMLTFVYNADDTVQNARLYINGIEATPEYYENANEGLYLSNSDIYIGAVNNGSHCRLNGTIDEVRIYNRALSPEQIMLLYTNTTTIIASQETEEDDVWYVCATPNDNQQDGTTKCSNNLTIRRKPRYNISNISVTKFDFPDPVNVSSNLTYVINITSNGNGTAYNVTVNDTYPLQVIYLTSQPTPLTGTNNTWQLGNLTPGTNISINITVLVLNLTNGTIINNTVNISFNNETGALINRSTTINTTILVPVIVVYNFTNISITKTDNPDPVNASTELYYQINISSTGNGTAYNVTVNDTYPAQVIYLTSQPTPLTGTNNTWQLGNLTPGTNISINITVLVLNVSNGTIINNTATVSFFNDTEKQTSASATINTTVLSYPVYNFTNLTITKTDKPDPVNISTNLTYQINISSLGNGTAYNVIVNDTYPEQIIYLSANPAPDSGTNNTWSIGTLLPGTNISINITVFVKNITSGTVINNTVKLTYQNETGQTTSINATARTTIMIERYFVETIEQHFIMARPGPPGRADLYINDSDINFNVSNPYEGENITIHATVHNIGQGAAANVEVYFWDGPNGTGILIGNTTLSGPLLGGKNATANMTYISIIGNRTITVVVDPNGRVPESNETNNKANRTLNVKSTTIYTGMLFGNITLETELNWTKYNFGFNNSGNIYIFCNGSKFNFSMLQALGRNRTGGVSLNDFGDADFNLNSTFFNDSIRILWGGGSNSTPIRTINFTVYNNTIEFVPVINSTNSSTFVTGILWDMDDDTNGEYDTGDNEDLVFISNINMNQTGGFSQQVDYEARIPTLVRRLRGTLNKTTYIVELQ